MSELRGYVVHDGWREQYAVLAFAPTAREARRIAWPTINGYGCGEFLEVRAEWARTADPSVWLVTEPCVLEPEVCSACELWYATQPVGVDGLCESCRDDIDR